MANELYLVTWGILGDRYRAIINAESEEHLRNTYPWHSDSEIKCIGIALPGGPTGIICSAPWNEPDED